jgi:hypothetical protein
MSLSLIIIANVALDAVLLGGLAWVLSRPARLTPHVHPRASSRVHQSARRADVRAAPASAGWTASSSRQAA